MRMVQCEWRASRHILWPRRRRVDSRRRSRMQDFGLGCRGQHHAIMGCEDWRAVEDMGVWFSDQESSMWAKEWLCMRLELTRTRNSRRMAHNFWALWKREQDICQLSSSTTLTRKTQQAHRTSTQSESSWTIVRQQSPVSHINRNILSRDTKMAQSASGTQR